MPTGHANDKTDSNPVTIRETEPYTMTRNKCMHPGYTQVSSVHMLAIGASEDARVASSRERREKKYQSIPYAKS